jgi:hypothetical protein
LYNFQIYTNQNYTHPLYKLNLYIFQIYTNQNYTHLFASTSPRNKAWFQFSIFGPKGKIRKRESLARNIPFGASAEAQVQAKPSGNIRRKKNSPGPMTTGP